MGRLLDGLGAVALVGGIITAWILVPLIGVIIGSGLLILFFYHAFQDERKTKHQPQQMESNSTDQSNLD